MRQHFPEESFKTNPVELYRVISNFNNTKV